MRKLLPATIFGAIVVTLIIQFLPTDPAAPNLPADETPNSAFSSERKAWMWSMLHDPATGEIPYGMREREIAFASTLPRRDRGIYLAKRNGAADPVWRQRGPVNVGGRTRALAFDITGHDTLLAGGVSSGVWRSSDMGETWTLTTTPEQALGASTIVQDTREGRTHIWYYGTGEGLGSSTSSVSSYYAGNGIYRSTDNGRSWTHLPGSSSGTPATRDVEDIVWNLAIDPSNLEEDELYAAVDGAIRRSTDGGESWERVLGDSLTERSPSYSDVAVTSDGVVYAMIASSQLQRGIYRSTDGLSFTRITPSNYPPNYNRGVFAIAPSNEKIVYFIAETPRRGKGTGPIDGFDAYFHSLWTYEYISGDGDNLGGKWEDRSEGIPDIRPGLGGYNSQGGYNMTINVKPDDEDVVFLGGTNVYRSTDGFRSEENMAWIGGYGRGAFDFSRTGSPLIDSVLLSGHHPDIHDVVFSPSDPDFMLTASDGGVHATTDPLADSVVWISLNSGYITSQFYSVAVNQDPETPEVLIGGLQDNGTWRNNGDDLAPWKEVSGSDGGYTAVSSDGKRIFTSKQQGVLYAIELDDEGTQTEFRRIDPLNGRNILFIAPYAIDPNSTTAVYYPRLNSLYRNRDILEIPANGDTAASEGWEVIFDTVAADGPVFKYITSITCTEKNPSSRLWLGIRFSRVVVVDNALGDNPTIREVSDQSWPDSAYILSIAADPTDGDHAVVVFSNYGIPSLFATDDGGESWTDVSGNLEENRDGTGDGPSTRSMKILNRGGERLYLLGTSAGLYSTDRLDGANTTWVREGAESIGYNVVSQVDARQADGLVAIATHGMGIFSATFEVSGVGREERTTTPLSVVPNPLKANGTITYTLPTGSGNKITLQLYDLAGRAVRSINLNPQRPGTHTRSIDAGELPRGIYIVRLASDNNPIATTRIIVE